MVGFTWDKFIKLTCIVLTLPLIVGTCWSTHSLSISHWPFTLLIRLAIFNYFDSLTVGVIFRELNQLGILLAYNVLQWSHLCDHFIFLSFALVVLIAHGKDRIFKFTLKLLQLLFELKLFNSQVLESTYIWHKLDFSVLALSIGVLLQLVHLILEQRIVLHCLDVVIFLSLNASFY